MAAVFCFTIAYENKPYTARFHSTEGDEYVLSCETFNNTYNALASLQPDYPLLPIHQPTNAFASLYSSSFGTIIIEWKNMSSKFITTQFFDLNYKILKEENYFVSAAERTSFIIPNVGSGCRPHLAVVNIVPYVRVTKSITPSVQQSVQVKKEQKLEQLSTDMGYLLQTGNYYDIVLSDGSKEIRAHRLILSTRSSVFAKMLQHPMKENRENRITIKDTSIEVLEVLLNFMYTGTVTIKDSKMARELYMAADKYDIKDLRNICSAMLVSVDLNNVYDTLLLSDLYSDRVLKEAALRFISENYSQLKALENWNDFMKEHQILAIEILSFVIDKKI